MRYRVTSLAKVQEDLSPPDANGAGHIRRCLQRCQPISRGCVLDCEKTCERYLNPSR